MRPLRSELRQSPYSSPPYSPSHLISLTHLSLSLPPSAHPSLSTHLYPPPHLEVFPGNAATLNPNSALVRCDPCHGFLPDLLLIFSKGRGRGGEGGRRGGRGRRGERERGREGERERGREGERERERERGKGKGNGRGRGRGRGREGGISHLSEGGISMSLT